MNSKIPVAVVGASGYTGLELIKILLNHPYFKLVSLYTSEGDSDIVKLHPSLKSVFYMDVKKTDPVEISKKAELAFLALPHKTAMGFAKKLLDLGVKVVDLSADYRLELETYEKFYCPHEDREHLKDAVYGLPEFYRDEIKDSVLVANPGCYPTASLLAVLPFGELIDENFPVFIDAKSGVSGAGKKCSQKVHFVTINENIFSYNPLSHRHSPEIGEKIEKICKKKCDINFVPHLLPVTRGMLVSVYMRLKEETDPLEHLKKFYKDEYFIRVREEPVDIKSGAGTNFCDIYAKAKGKNVFVSSSIDNLLRGASSQAVVNANIMFGLKEREGIPTISYVP